MAAPWTVETGTDLLWALMSGDFVDNLTIDRGWPVETYATRMATLFRSVFVVPAS